MGPAEHDYRQEAALLREELAHLKHTIAAAKESDLPVVEMLLRDNRRRIEAEQALVDSRKWMELAQETGGVASYYMDVPAGELWWSHSVYRLYGLDPADGRPSVERWLSTIHPDDRAGVARVAEGAIERGLPIDHYFRAVVPGHGVRWIHDRGTVELDAAGRPLRLHGVNIDITETRLAQQQLRDSEEQFRNTFEFANVGVAHVSLTGEFLLVNDRLCRLMGRDRHALAGMTFQDLTHPDDLDADLAHLRRLIAGEIGSYTMEKRYLRPDGSFVWADLSVALLREVDGTPIHFISVMADAHERKMAQQQLELVLGESNHRVKNLITILTALIRASARSAGSVQDLEKTVTDRLLGIAASHDLLMGKYSTGATLDRLVRRQLDIFTDCSTERIVIAGPVIDLVPRAVHAFGMVLHELATNACKHGALSGSEGIVRISWMVDAERQHLTFEWREEGGPPVVHSGRQGFGTRALERMLTGSLGGHAEHALPADGALFTATVLLEGLVASSPAQP